MSSFYEILYKLGSSSFDGFWFPVFIWTLLSTLILLSLRLFKNTNPLYQYHIRVATIFALPIGIVLSMLVQFIPSFISESASFSSAVLIVQNPIYEITAFGTSTEMAQLNWLNSNIIIGGITLVLFSGSIIIMGKLINSYLKLRELHKSLLPQTLCDFDNSFSGSSVAVAFHNNPLVPFTFGWNKPIIVLPHSLKDDPKRLNMAIKHELVHIRRGDYLIQLILSVVSSLVWFHPLIKISNKEIEQYREISCDQEVLNTTTIKPKEYAAMLLDLIPLQRGFGSFTVNMAVKQSTLKQRIETMKYHKMNKTSYARSFLIFLGITLIIVAPIACSDLKGPETLSEEEIVTAQLLFEKPLVEINGKEIFKSTNTQKVSGLDGLMIAPAEYGTFIISTTKFEGASLSGEITGNQFTTNINNLKLILTGENSIYTDKTIEVWVKHYPNKKWNHNVLGKMPYEQIHTSGFLDDLKPVDVPNPPIPSNPDEEVFVVVEQMPQLIGGQAAIQSKVQYPKQAIKAGIEGRVTVQFIVDENGDVTNASVIKGIGGGLDEEALRVVRAAKFEPGIQRGRKVKLQMSMPIIFKLRNSE